MDRLPRDFYRRDPRVVAPELLNKVLARDDGRSGRIVEVEAYCGGEDPASHSYRGMTARNEVMFGAPGFLYVYFTYGMHWCCNPVCGEDGQGVAVLLRALSPLTGIDAMRMARGPSITRDRDLCNGPAKLCSALGLTGAENGADLVTGDSGVWISDDGCAPPDPPATGVRIGISAAADEPWRWWVPGDENVSRRG
ncbi:MAG: DNA-3-methyladenine glycosylase [Acidimicrobiaceae bacterium]|nr:DNA-3-methyladenine glycosylase [Acidimicrobiaceae bacterium]